MHDCCRVYQLHSCECAVFSGISNRAVCDELLTFTETLLGFRHAVSEQI